MLVAPPSSNTVLSKANTSERVQPSVLKPNSNASPNAPKPSGKNLAKLLKAQGLTPSQIAIMMGSDLKTVDDYLDIAPPQADSGTYVVKLSGKALAKSLKEQGLTPSQVAAMMGSDLKTVNDYLGITPATTKSLYNSKGSTTLF